MLQCGWEHCRRRMNVFYLNGCDLFLLKRTDVVDAGRGLQFFRLIAPIRWLANPRTRLDLPCADQFQWGVLG
jgi:hypothetical protein